MNALAMADLPTEPAQEVEFEHRASPRRRTLAVWAFAVAVALVGSLLLFRPSGNSAAMKPAPSFSLEGVRDPTSTVSLADFAGRPVVLNFFASWCAPCRRELPHLKRAAERWGDDVAFVGIAHQDVRSDTVKLMDDFGIQYAAGYDPRGRVAAAYSLLGLPATVFITPDGTIASLVQGEINASTLEEQVERLMSLSGADQAALRIDS